MALLSAGTVDEPTATAFARVANAVLAEGGTILLSTDDPLLAAPTFRGDVLGETAPHATLDYAQGFALPGLHLVRTDTANWDENLAGLGACGAHMFVGLVGDGAQQAHPLLPVLQVATPAAEVPAGDVDACLTGDASSDAATLLRLVCRTAGREYVPVANAGGFVDFQLTRGLLGVSA